MILHWVVHVRSPEDRITMDGKSYYKATEQTELHYNTETQEFTLPGMPKKLRKDYYLLESKAEKRVPVGVAISAYDLMFTACPPTLTNTETTSAHLSCEALLNYLDIHCKHQMAYVLERRA